MPKSRKKYIRKTERSISMRFSVVEVEIILHYNTDTHTDRASTFFPSKYFNEWRVKYIAINGLVTEFNDVASACVGMFIFRYPIPLELVSDAWVAKEGSVQESKKANHQHMFCGDGRETIESRTNKVTSNVHTQTHTHTHTRDMTIQWSARIANTNKVQMSERASSDRAENRRESKNLLPKISNGTTTTTTQEKKWTKKQQNESVSSRYACSGNFLFYQK